MMTLLALWASYPGEKVTFHFFAQHFPGSTSSAASSTKGDVVESRKDQPSYEHWGVLGDQTGLPTGQLPPSVQATVSPAGRDGVRLGAGGGREPCGVCTGTWHALRPGILQEALSQSFYASRCWAGSQIWVLPSVLHSKCRTLGS